VDAAIELNAGAILISTIISHDDVHYKNMKKIHNACIEKGIRDKIILIAGGTQVTPELARKNGMDQGFGRGSNGTMNATFLVKRREEMSL
jgi:D-ornithine 4,5-aminomutase subunit beta